MSTGPIVAEAPRRFADAHATVAALRARRDATRREVGPSPVRILFVVANAATWGALAPIATAARATPGVAVTVVALDGPGDATRSTAAHLAAHGLPTTDAERVVADLETVDIAFLQDPYDEFRPPHLSVAALLERGIRLAYSPYAENIGGGAEIARQYDTHLHNLAWRVFVPDATQRSLYARHCEAGDAHVRAFGSVKGEWLTTADAAVTSAASALRRRLRTRTAVLWNPHFRRGHDGWSTFERYVNDVLAFAAADPGIGWVIRPHFRLLRDLQAVPGGEAFVADVRRAWAGLPNIVVDEGADYRAPFAATDAMVSDLSSLIPEYLRLDKPVAYLVHPSPPPTVADETWLPRVRTVRDAAGLHRFVRGVRPHRAQIRLPDERGIGARIVDSLVSDVRAEVWP